MPRGVADGQFELPALGKLYSAISRRGFQTVDLLSAFVKPDGPPIGRGARFSPDFNLGDGLLNGRVKVLAKTDFPEWRNK